jgi:hypothetical protein
MLQLLWVSSDFVAFGDKLSPVLLLLPAINCRRFLCYWRLIIAVVGVTGDQLIAGIMESMKILNKA